MDRFTLVIVGSGPGGIAAAAQAASVGMDYVVLERSGRFADTIHDFAKGKLVMNTPKRLPLHPGLPLSFTEGSVERVLATWRRDLDSRRVLKRIRLNSEVTSITRGDDGIFHVALANGRAVEGRNVILALGTQGNITRLTVPGAARVRYQLSDPTAFSGGNIVVIGSGDTAIENAIALAEQNRVTMVVRSRTLKPEKVTVANLAAIEAAVRAGTVEIRFNAETIRVEDERIVLAVAGAEETLPCDEIIARIGSVKPRKFLEACGVRFDGEDENADPAIDSRYCSDVDGLYVIGALAGYPLIKHCLNQGYEVVEHIRGAAVMPADRPVLQETLEPIAAGASVEQVLKRITSTVPLFSGLSRLTLGDVLLDSKVLRLAVGEPVIRRGEYGDSIFALYDGTVAVEVNPKDPSERRALKPGDFFGEMGLVSGRPRSATVRATSAATLIEVPRRAALKLFNAVPSAKSQMDEALIARQIRAYVSEDLPDRDLAELVASVRIISFAYGDTIIESGRNGDEVFLIQSGSAKVSSHSWGQDVVLRYLPAGQMIGDYAHLKLDKPYLTVTAATKTVAIRIGGDAFARVLARNASLKWRLQQRMEAALREDAEKLGRPRTSGAVFNDFLAEGVGEATNILVIDETICTRCDNCERACADTHGGISRLNREAGPTFATLHVPTSCRHCQHPHCMSDCPADAIHRALNGEVYIDESCIGCGACERNCPYDVIHMAAEPEAKPNLLMWLLFGWGSGPGEDDSHEGLARRTGPKHAVKCDMCQGSSTGPACVQACPTGAAMRVSPTQLLAITQAVRA